MGLKDVIFRKCLTIIHGCWILIMKLLECSTSFLLMENGGTMNINLTYQENMGWSTLSSWLLIPTTYLFWIQMLHLEIAWMWIMRLFAEWWELVIPWHLCLFLFTGLLYVLWLCCTWKWKFKTQDQSILNSMNWLDSI